MYGCLFDNKIIIIFFFFRRLAMEELMSGGTILYTRRAKLRNVYPCSYDIKIENSHNILYMLYVLPRKKSSISMQYNLLYRYWNTKFVYL